MAGDDSDRAIEQLLADGNLEQAASLLEGAGRWRQALQLYESLWDFAAAARVAREAGDLPLALQNTLRQQDRAGLDALIAALADADAATQRRCAAICEERGQPAHAGLFRERAGDFDLAIERYESAGLLSRAARLCEQRGDSRRAIALYRRQLQRDAPATTAEAPPTAEDQRDSFDLARLLLRHGRPTEAIPLLQAVWQAGTTVRACDAGIACVGALQRAGYAHAAQATLAAIQQDTADEISLAACLQDARFVPIESADDNVVLAGRYRLDELVGSGGMSRVYRAHDLIQDRAVAVKVFSGSGGSRGRDGRRRFAREALLTGKLDHPHIVACDDFIDEGFMVLEYMAGGSLAARVPPPLSLPACRAVALQILSALQAAHQRGIVHRDVKPSNIFFNEAGVAKLGDFGIAHLQDQGLTQTGAFIGTIAFMAPEQIRGAAVTFATDIYALGATLHVMLTGAHPYAPPNVLRQHLEGALPRPTTLVESLPPVCDELIARCMAKDPSDRYDSLDALRTDIERLPADVVLQPAAPAARPTDAPTQAPPPLARYAAEGPPRRSGLMEIQPARDAQLGRPVLLLRLPPPTTAPQPWRLLRAAARGDERLQRVLSLDPEAGLAVLAAEPEVPSPAPAEPADGLELCRRLALAIEPLHAAGLAHGAIDSDALLRIGRFHELALLPALKRLARQSTDAEQHDDTLAADLQAIALLAEIALPEAVPDAAALAAWAEAEQRRLADAKRQQRHQTQLERALASAPAAVPRLRR